METKKLLSVIAFVAATTLSNASFAQVKVGANPTTITPGANLDVEATAGSHTVVMQSGAVGVNTVAPQAWLDVRGTTKILPSSGTQTGTIWTGDSNMDGMEVTASNGALYVGIQRGAGAPLHLSKPSSLTEDSFLICSVGGIGGVGSIRYNGASGVVYLTTSDQRLKENIQATKFGLEALKTVKVYDYNFKADSKKTLSTGVLAQELHKVYPQAVTVGGTDAKTNPWQVDYSKLVPMLVKSVQELSDKVESLTSEKAQLSAELKRKEAAYTELNDRITRMERLLSSGENTKSVSK
ncbi:tail fiber domain-containing protein [Dyadobacter sp. MSC1_007]|jgi:uncharacterized small protein (DUF1192 family)|uniref:tail fiber domain-containing protein n=1 Tax=Dyadobacter sp. MSC1_007 TaxID=2909264 RepID=UPI00202E5FA6|nr:tail fiber domain-containing protein [Dyadobacter sp. MSC1_007]